MENMIITPAQEHLLSRDLCSSRKGARLLRHFTFRGQTLMDSCRKREYRRSGLAKGYEQ